MPIRIPDALPATETLKGENIGMKEMRGHATWYIKGLPGSHPVKDRLARVCTYDEFDQILSDYADQLCR